MMKESQPQHDDSEEFSLLEDDQSQDPISKNQDLQTAPLYTHDAYQIIKDSFNLHMQYGLLGRILSIRGKKEIVKDIQDRRLYLNTNAPFSAIICGVQGSGKSHTVSTMIENMLLSDCPQIGNSEVPLCGLVFHFGQGGASSLPNEAAWVSQSPFSIKAATVKVYVSPSSLQTMKAVYRPLGDAVRIEPLYFDRTELDAAAFLSMMSIGGSNSAPLYMQVIMTILRSLGENFTYDAFTSQLENHKINFNPNQLSGLEQRMSLLNSFLYPSQRKKNRFSFEEFPTRFSAGQLTIIDLSDPFIDEDAAASLFEILLRLFGRADVGTKGKLVLVDEAHKYLSKESGLSKALLRLVREQRHNATRVIISTQEPTVISPDFLALCEIKILHRFSSPAWWKYIIQHVSADFNEDDAFDQIVRLQTGQAMILAPTGLASSADRADHSVPNSIIPLQRTYLIAKTRKRLTVDGGASVLVLN